MNIKQYKKLARANAKANGTSHQAELDAIARGHGHSSWGPFQASIRQKTTGETCPVRSFVDSLGADEETATLVEDALNGYLAENGAGIDDYVESYEFRGEAGDILPDEHQRLYIARSIARYVRKLDSARRAEQTERLGRAIEAVKEIGFRLPLPRLARIPVLPRVPPPLPQTLPASLGLAKNTEYPSLPAAPASIDDDMTDGDGDEHKRPAIRPVHVREFPRSSLRPVSVPKETPRPGIRFVEPYSPPAPPAPPLHLKPVGTAPRPWPKIERVETPQDLGREMAETMRRGYEIMDRLQEKLAEHRTRRQGDDVE